MPAHRRNLSPTKPVIGWMSVEAMCALIDQLPEPVCAEHEGLVESLVREIEGAVRRTNEMAK